jgi:tetratricopeptide (TPR) repeat protein
VRAVSDCLQREFALNRTVVCQLAIIAGGRESRLAGGAERLREFLQTSAPTNWRWTFLDGARLGHTETPYAGIPQGIRFVHDGDLWEMPTTTADSILRGFVDPDQAMRAWYKALSARVGYDVAPSAKWLGAAVREYVGRRDLVAAEADARRAVDAYPEDHNTYANLADVFISRNDPAAARRTLADALRVLDRLDFFDETERALKRSVLRSSLEKLAPESERYDR